MIHRNHVLFVYPPVMRKYPPTDPPFGMMYLSAILREAGFDVRILDLNALRWPDEKVEAFFRENSFPLIGLGGMTTVYYYVKWLASLIHRVSPETILVGGGSLATPCPETILEHTPLQAVCIGEGEPIITELIQKLLAKKPLNDIPGLAFKDGSGRVVKTSDRPVMRDLDSLPFPAYDLVDMDIYLENATKRPSLISWANRKGIPLDGVSKSFIMFSSRGCPFTCTFCYRNFGHRVRRHSIDYLFKHIRYIGRKFGVNNIAFYDETFNSDRSWVLDFCHRAKEETPGNFYWMGGARVDLLDEEVLQALKTANFYEISVGVESFDDRSLKEMGKKFDSRTLLATLIKLQAYELGPSYLGMLYGFPGDDYLSLHRTVEAICHLGIPAYFQFPLPFPGTILFEDLRRQGRIKDVESFMLGLSDRMAQELVVNISRYPDEKLVRMVRKAEAKVAACLKNRELEEVKNAEGVTPIPRFPRSDGYVRRWLWTGLEILLKLSKKLKKGTPPCRALNLRPPEGQASSLPKPAELTLTPQRVSEPENPPGSLRVALLGNMANNAFNMVNILRNDGIFAQLVDDGKDLFPFSRPLWEECKLTLDYSDVMQSGWTFDRWLEMESKLGWKNGGRVTRPHLEATHLTGQRYPEWMLASFDEECRKTLLQVAATYSQTIEALKTYEVVLAFGFYAAVCAYFAEKPTIYFTYGGDCRLELADYDGSRRVVSKCFEQILKSSSFVIEGYGCDKEIHDILRGRGLLGKVAYVFLPNINTKLFRHEWDKEKSRSNVRWPPDKFILLLASRVDYFWKKSDLFLEAFQKFACDKNDALLVITGWGKDYPDARSRIEKWGLLSKVLFLPDSFSKPELFERYAAVDLIVDQFKVGSLGSVSYEALCMGKPVLTYLAPFNLMCFPHQPPILNARTENDILDQLEFAASNRNSLVNMGRAGAKWYETVYSEKNLKTSVQRLAIYGTEKWISYSDFRNRPLSENYIPIPDHNAQIRLLPWPYPYRAGLTIANDCEYYCWKDFCDLHQWLSAKWINGMGEGIRLPISDSFWFYSEDSPNLGFSYFEGTDGSKRSPFAPYLSELLKLGLVDTLHAYGGFDLYGSFRRDHAKLAIDELDRLGVQLKVWSNHGNANNAQNLGGLWANDYSRGDQPGSGRYHADLLVKAGVRYFWLDSYSTNRFSLGNPKGRSFENGLAGKDDSLLEDNILCREKLRDGQTVLAFRRFRGLRGWAPDPWSLAGQLSLENLDHIEDTGGGAIIYQHFGCSRDQAGMPGPRNGRPIPEEAQKQLRELASRYKEKRIWVSSCSSFLRYLEVVSDLRVEIDSREEGVILLLYGNRRDWKESDLKGIHLNVKGKVNIIGIEMASSPERKPCKDYHFKEIAPQERIVFWEEPSWPDFPFTGQELLQ